MEYSNKEKFDELRKDNGKVLAVFSADWCGPCKHLTPILEELQIEGTTPIIKINVDTEGELAQTYKIRGIPTLVFMKGEEINEQMVGNQPKAEIRRALLKL